MFHQSPYSTPTVPANMKPGQGDCLLWGAGTGNPPEVFRIAAFGDRELVEENQELWDNNVYFYLFNGLSGGFSGKGDVIPDPGDKGFFDCAERLSWHLNGAGGYRAGCAENLDDSTVWRKMVFFGPAGVFCRASICPYGKILKNVDLPSYCMASQCTIDECCEPARTCSADICTGGFLLKLPDVRPEFCGSAFCLETECCQEAPVCQASDCPVGQFLKPVGPLPPLGQSATGCMTYVCKEQECCNDSPRCPATLCPESMRLTTLDPTPYCSSYDCLVSDCCTDAGICSEELCPEDHALDPMHRQYCARPECTLDECCYPLPPNISVTNLHFIDEDIRPSVLGGTITWEPTPPSTPGVTHYTIHLVYGERRVRAGNVSWGTNEFTLPEATPYTAMIMIYTQNIGGEAMTPTSLEVVDTKFFPRDFSFTDLDLDPGEFGGTITWINPVTRWLESDEINSDTDEVDTSPIFCLVKPCRFGTSLRVDGGNGTDLPGALGSPPAFFKGDEPLENVSDDTMDGIGVTLAILSQDLSEVMTVQNFDTATNETASDALLELLNGVQEGSVLLLATFGAASTFLSPQVIGRLGAFGAQRLALLEPHDSYALVVVHAGDFRVREVLVRATTGADQRAVAEVRCPVSSLEVQLQNGPDLISNAGLAPDAIAFDLAEDFEAKGSVYGALFIHSPIRRQFVDSFKFEDSDGTVSNLQYIETDPTKTADLAGIVSWTGPKSMTGVKGFQVCLATDAEGRDRMDLVEGALSLSNKFEIPEGTDRSNFTHLLVYAVSELGEQSRPVAASLTELLGLAAAAASVAVVGSVAAIQAARVAGSIAERMNMESLERVATKLDAAKDMPVPILDYFIPDPDDAAALSKFGAKPLAISPVLLIDKTMWRSVVAPLVRCVHHHDPVIRVNFDKASDAFSEPQVLCRVEACNNIWDNDEILLQKISNREIAIHTQHGQEFHLVRKVPLYWRCFEKGIFSRAAFRMYAPMVVLIGIAAILLMAGDRQLAIILLVLVFMGCIVMFIASRGHFITDFMSWVQSLPPERIRGKFWVAVQLFMGILPCAPAFIAQTLVGYLAGCIAIVGAVLCAMQAYGLAAFVEGCGGAALAVFSMYQKMVLGETSNQAEASTYTAQFMAATLVSVKALDSWMESTEMLFKPDNVTTDLLLKEALPLEADTNVGLSNAIALEAFKRGTVSRRLQIRLCKAFRVAGHGLVSRARLAVNLLQDDLYGDSGSRWPKSSERMGIAVGRAIDAASADFFVDKLRAVRSSAQRRPVEEMIEERLQDLEDALKHLLNGPLASKSVLHYKACIKELNESINDLSTGVTRIEECVGLSEPEGFLAAVEVVGCYAAMVVASGKFLKQELESGEVTKVDVQILRVKLALLREQATRVASVLEVVMPPPAPPTANRNGFPSALGVSATKTTLGSGGSAESEHKMTSEESCDLPNYEDAIREANLASSRMQEELRMADEALSLDHSSAGFLAEATILFVKASLVEALDEADMLLSFQELMCDSGRLNYGGEVNAQLKHDAVKDVKNRARNGGTMGAGKVEKEKLKHSTSKKGRKARLQTKELQEDSAQALCLCRSSVALAAAVSAELRVAVERAEAAVSAMAESRRMGYRVLHLVQQAREYLASLTASQIAKLQEEAMQYTVSEPMKALAHLQEAELQPCRAILLTFQDHLKNLSVALENRPLGSPGSAGDMAGPYKLRIQTEPDSSLDPVEEMEVQDHDFAEGEGLRSAGATIDAPMQLPGVPGSPVSSRHVRQGPDS